MTLKSSIPVVLITCALFVSKCITVSDFDRGYLIAAQNEPVEMDFAEESGLIVLKATINGERGRFVFDNGFSLSAINEDFAARAGIVFSDESDIRDANNMRAQFPETTVARTEIGGQVFVDTGFLQVDTDLFVPCSPVDGIIGASIINKINWSFDFENNKVLLDSKPFDSEGIHLSTSFSSNNSTFAKLKLNNLPIKTKIDFGRSGEFKMGIEEFYSDFVGDSAEARIGFSSLSATGLGMSDTTYHMAGAYEISTENEDFPVGGKVELTREMKYQAYAGIGWFKKYNVTINSSRDEYVLSPRSMEDTGSSPITYPLSVYPVDEVYRIIQMNSSDAISQHVSLWDEVSSIDGRPMDSFTDICALRDFMKDKRDRKESWTLQTTDSAAPVEVPLKKTEYLVLK